jgi:hypothetical protein
VPETVRCIPSEQAISSGNMRAQWVGCYMAATLGFSWMDVTRRRVESARGKLWEVMRDGYGKSGLRCR